MSFKKSFVLSLLFSVSLLYGSDNLIDSPYEQSLSSGFVPDQRDLYKKLQEKETKLSYEKWLFLYGKPEERMNYSENGNPSEYFKVMEQLPLFDVRKIILLQYKQTQDANDAEIAELTQQKRQEEERMALESEEQEASDGQSSPDATDDSWLYDNGNQAIDTVASNVIPESGQKINSDDAHVLDQDYQECASGKVRNKIKGKEEFIATIRQYSNCSGGYPNIKATADAILGIFYDNTYGLPQFNSISRRIGFYLTYLEQYLRYFKTSKKDDENPLLAYMKDNPLDAFLQEKMDKR